MVPGAALVVPEELAALVEDALVAALGVAGALLEVTTPEDVDPAAVLALALADDEEVLAEAVELVDGTEVSEALAELLSVSVAVLDVGSAVEEMVEEGRLEVDGEAEGLEADELETIGDGVGVDAEPSVLEMRVLETVLETMLELVLEASVLEALVVELTMVELLEVDEAELDGDAVVETDVEVSLEDVVVEIKITDTEDPDCCAEVTMDWVEVTSASGAVLLVVGEVVLVSLQ